MKRYNIFIGLIIFLMYPYMLKAQYASKYKLTNFVQVDETSLQFDLELHNTGTIAFGLDAAQCRIDYNKAIYGSDTSNIMQLRAVTPLSTSLVGWYGGDGVNPPTLLSQRMTVTGNSGFIIFVTNPLADADYQIIDLIQPNAFIKLATIKILFTTGSGPLNNQKNKPFEEVLHNLAFNVTMGNHTLIRVNAYDDTSPPDVYKVGLQPAYTSMPQPLTENLPSSTANRKLAKYCFTGNGDFATNTLWNNATSTTITGYHATPPSLANALISGNATLSTNQTLTDLTLKAGTVTLTLNAGTQLSVDGSLYNDNATAGALTLKADGGVHPTASLKNNTASVTATVEQYIASADWLAPADGWHLLSSPVENQNISGSFTPTGSGNDYDCFAWDEASYTWFNQKDVNNHLSTFVPGSGYLVAYQQAGTKTFSGNLNAANLTENLSFANAIANLQGFNLIGNPFPCAINWGTGSWIKSSIENSAKVWDANGKNYIDVTLQDTPNRYVIPAMQGFFVRATENIPSPSIVIPADAKVHSSQGFYKTTNDMLIMKVSKDNATVYDKAAISFNSLSTNLYDPTYDASEMQTFGDAPGLYSMLTTGEKLSINTIPLPTVNTMVSLGFIAGTNASYTFNASNLANISFTHPIILEDTKTGLIQDLFQNPIYHFTASTTDSANRFILHFNAASMSIPENGMNNILAYCNNGQLMVSSNSVIKSIEIYNEIGQQLVVYKVNGNNFSTKISGKVQLLRILTNQGVMVKKVVGL